MIKENRIDRIVSSLECIERNPLDRDLQRDCVLKLYKKAQNHRCDGTTEHFDKGIFRGMIITTLGMLGLIVNTGKSISPSENGFLVLMGRRNAEYENLKILPFVFREIDHDNFGFVETISNEYGGGCEVSTLINDIEEYTKPQKKERVKRWIEVLKSVGLVSQSEGGLILINRPLIAELNMRRPNFITLKGRFEDAILEKYGELASKYNGIVRIEDLRIEIALKFLMDYNEIITKNNFDQLLSTLEMESNNYRISFGKPMGAAEKLFKYKGNSYRTIYISRRRG